MSDTSAHTDISPGIDPALYSDPYADLPPNLDTDAQGVQYLLRFALIGGVVGVLGGLVSMQLALGLAVGVLLLWILGSVAAGILGGLGAKKHRAGVGYPADAAAWVRSYAFTVPAVGAVIGVVTVIAAVSTAIIVAGPDGKANYTPAVLLAVVTVLAAALLRWLTLSQPHRLIYGGRR